MGIEALAPQSIFSRHRAWLGELCRIATRLLSNSCAAAAPGAQPGLVLCVHWRTLSGVVARTWRRS